MSPLIRPIDPPGPRWPKVTTRSYERPDDPTMLAALERARRLTRHPDKKRIAAVLGFGFSGAASRSMEDQLRRMESAGLVRSAAKYQSRQRDWFLTEEGARALERERPSAGPLPESPEHRHWRECRALAEGQLAEVSEAALEALATARAAVADRAGTDLGATDVALLERLLDWRMKRLGVVLFCLREWAEPDDDSRDDRARGASPTYFYAGHLELLNATEQDELDHLNPRFEVVE